MRETLSSVQPRDGRSGRDPATQAPHSWNMTIVRTTATSLTLLAQNTGSTSISPDPARPGDFTLPVLRSSPRPHRPRRASGIVSARLLRVGSDRHSLPVGRVRSLGDSSVDHAARTSLTLRIMGRIFPTPQQDHGSLAASACGSARATPATERPGRRGVSMMRLSVVVLLLLLPVRGLAQSAVATEPPRTPWGDPDLRGMWDFATLTPLQRPPDISTTTFTEEEAAEFERRFQARLEGLKTAFVHATWMLDFGTSVTEDRRTSLVVDPPGGRIPPLTPEAQEFAARSPARPVTARMARGPLADGPEYRGLRASVWSALTPDRRCLRAPT